MLIPQKKYYKINHFKNYLLNYEDSEDISNYTNIINELDCKLKNCSRINQTILAFSIILLFYSNSVIFIIIIFIFRSRKSKMIDTKIFLELTRYLNIIRLFLTSINLILALNIIFIINEIRKKEDKIGLTNEIKSGIIKVIIILSFYIIYCNFEVFFITFYTTKCLESLFLCNKYYFEKELNQQNNKLEINKINIDEINSKTSARTLKEKEKSEVFKIEKINEKKLLQLLKEKEKDIYELKDHK